MFKRIAYGTPAEGHGDDSHDDGDDDHKVWDVNFREGFALSIFVVFVFWVGFQPMPFLDFMHVSVENLVNQVQGTVAP